MINRRFGLVLILLLAIASAAGAVYADFHYDNAISRERAATDAMNLGVRTAHVSLANLRGAQAAYFAVGQGPDFWPTRARALAAELEQTIATLHAASVSPAAKTFYDSAVSALGSLNTLDQKARDDLDIGETRLAADLMFSDATASADALTAALVSAQHEELIARAEREGTLRRERIQYTVAGVAGMLLAALILAFGHRSSSDEGASAPRKVEGLALSGPSPTIASASTSAAEPPVVVQDAPIVVHGDRKPGRTVEGPAQTATEPPAPRVDLANAAEICVDLGRVLDAQDIPPLLERAARTLDAKGLVLWVADDSGAMLRASLAHGYPEKVLQRLGPLQVDADNVTSLAFRSMQAQTLADAKGAPRAFAVPLVTSTGCIGVLAAETASGQASADAVPVARMIAAQLATLVTPAQSPSAKVSY